MEWARPMNACCWMTGIKTLIFLSLCLAVSPLAHAMDVTLAWEANTEDDLAGYRVYLREIDEDFDYDNPEWEGTATSCTIQGLKSNTSYCFVGRAYDLAGNESEDSYEDCVSAGSGGSSSGSGCFISNLMK